MKNNKIYNKELESYKWNKQCGGELAALSKEVFELLKNFDTRPADDADYATESEEVFIFGPALEVAKTKFFKGDKNTILYIMKSCEAKLIQQSGALGEMFYMNCIRPVIYRLVDELLKIFCKYSETAVYQYLD